jgi:hypothetical protein
MNKWKRAKCDCGETLETWIKVKGDLSIEELGVHCKKCKQWMKRVKAMDTTELIDCKKPKEIRSGLRDDRTSSTVHEH